MHLSITQSGSVLIEMNRIISEIVGTFCLVFCGCGAVVVNDVHDGPLGHLGISLVFGLVVMSMIYAVGNISGAHLNPAVTLGFWVAKRFKASDIPHYIIAQCLGAILACSLLRFLYPEHSNLGATLPSVDIGRAFVWETVLSFMLMVVILNVSTGHMEKGIMAGVAVGGVIAFEALIGGPATGASMNPARSLGPALVSGQLQDLWIYLIAPIIGALLAAPTCRWIQGTDCCKNEEQEKSC